jgi:hypothetical protein
MAERSMALRSGDWSFTDHDTIRSLERGVGSNPTLFIFCRLVEDDDFFDLLGMSNSMMASP